MIPWLDPPPGPVAAQAFTAVGGVVAAGAIGVALRGLLRRKAPDTPSGGPALGRRMATLVALAVAVFVPTYLGGWAFALLVALLSGVGLSEFYAACRARGLAVEGFVGLAGTLSLVGTSFVGGLAAMGPVMAATALAVLVSGMRRVDDTLIARLGASFLGAGYLGLFAFLPLLRAFPNGFGWAIVFLMTVQLADVGALVGGLALGRRKLAPVLSPGKTVEGAVCGLLAGAAAGAGFGFLLGGVPTWAAALAGAILAVAGLFGDLAASSIKRAAGLKDFGTVLPGHGGILDRFDSYLFAAPVAYALAELAAWTF